MDRTSKKDKNVVHIMEEIIRNYLIVRLCVIYLILRRLGQHKKMKGTQTVLPYINEVGWCY